MIILWFLLLIAVSAAWGAFATILLFPDRFEGFYTILCPAGEHRTARFWVLRDWTGRCPIVATDEFGHRTIAITAPFVHRAFVVALWCIDDDDCRCEACADPAWLTT